MQLRRQTGSVEKALGMAYPRECRLEQPGKRGQSADSQLRRVELEITGNLLFVTGCLSRRRHELSKTGGRSAKVFSEFGVRANLLAPQLWEMPGRFRSKPLARQFWAVDSKKENGPIAVFSPRSARLATILRESFPAESLKVGRAPAPPIDSDRAGTITSCRESVERCLWIASRKPASKLLQQWPAGGRSGSSQQSLRLQRGFENGVQRR